MKADLPAPAGTDGERLYVQPDAIARWTLPQLAAVLATRWSMSFVGMSGAGSTGGVTVEHRRRPGDQLGLEAGGLTLPDGACSNKSTLG